MTTTLDLTTDTLDALDPGAQITTNSDRWTKRADGRWEAERGGHLPAHMFAGHLAAGEVTILGGPTEEPMPSVEPMPNVESVPVRSPEVGDWYRQPDGGYWYLYGRLTTGTRRFRTLGFSAIINTFTGSDYRTVTEVGRGVLVDQPAFVAGMEPVLRILTRASAQRDRLLAGTDTGGAPPDEPVTVQPLPITTEDLRLRLLDAYNDGAHQVGGLLSDLGWAVREEVTVTIEVEGHSTLTHDRLDRAIGGDTYVVDGQVNWRFSLTEEVEVDAGECACDERDWDDLVRDSDAMPDHYEDFEVGVSCPNH